MQPVHSVEVELVPATYDLRLLLILLRFSLAIGS